jgi:hypothetical protein
MENHPMNSLSRVAKLAAVVAAVGALAGPALAQDGPADARLHISGGSVAFLAGVSWGHGRLDFHGHSYRVKVRGLKVGSIGAASFHADGDVFHLHHLHDINGVYGAASASATAGPGAGAIQLRNGHGVLINMSMSSAGLQATLAPEGVDIELE